MLPFAIYIPVLCHSHNVVDGDSERLAVEMRCNSVPVLTGAPTSRSGIYKPMKWESWKSLHPACWPWGWDSFLAMDGAQEAGGMNLVLGS